MYVVVLDEEIDHGLWILQCPLIARLKNMKNPAREIKKLWKTPVNVLPIVIEALGAVPNLERNCQS